MIGMLGDLQSDQSLQIVGGQEDLPQEGLGGLLVVRGHRTTIGGEDHLLEVETDLDLLCIVTDIALVLPGGALQEGTIAEDLHQGGDHLPEDTIEGQDPIVGREDLEDEQCIISN